MKNVSLLLVIAFIFSWQDISSQTANDPVGYMEQLLVSFEEMEGAKWKYLKAVTRGRSARKVEKRRMKLINEYNEALTATRKVRAYEGDEILKPALIEYLKLTKTILKEDYDKILDMEAIAEESYDAMEAYILIQEKTDEKLSEASSQLNVAEKEFASLYNINLIEGEGSKRQERIKKASNALGHYNDVFLIFFKSSVQESYFLNAMAVDDIATMDQSVNALASNAVEGLESLKEVEVIRNDRSLITALKSILSFYKSETETDMKKMLDFYLVKDEFEKAQKKFDAIRKNKRTQADVDMINKASSAYNKGVNTINSAIESNNKKRDRVIKSWEKAVASYFDRNS